MTLAGCVLPGSDGFGSVNIIGSVLKHFGAPSPHGPLHASILDLKPFVGAKQIVLLTVDGLGYRTLKEKSKLRRLGLGRLARRTAPITTTAPSTTVTALTTLGTGKGPLEHGIMGYWQFVQRLGMLTNMLRFKPVASGGYLGHDFEPGSFQQNPGVFDLLAKKNVMGYNILRQDYLDSSLNRMSRAGAACGIGYINSSDLFVHARRTLLERKGKRTFLNLYWDKTDSISHAYGKESDEMTAELANFDFSLFSELLDRKFNDETLVLITADHGHITSSPRKSISFNDHPALLSMLILPPSGEARLTYLHVKNGRLDNVKEYLSDSQFGRHFHVLESADAIDKGVFGPGKPCQQALDAIGDLVMIPKDDWYAPYDFHPERERNPLIGRHGGLSAEEMEVPLIAMRV